MKETAARITGDIVVALINKQNGTRSDLICKDFEMIYKVVLKCVETGTTQD